MFHRPKSEERTQEQEAKQQESQTQDEAVTKAQDTTGQTTTSEGMGTTSETTTQEITNAKEETIMSNEQPENRETESQDAEAPAGAPFQRPPQMQRSVPGGFSGGNYVSTQGASGGMYDTRGSEDSRLVIGRGITMSGEIESCDHLLVEGTLEAALKGAKVLEIAQTGVFYGSVEIEEATVAGRFEGELTVNGRLTIKEGGSVTGSVAYKELAVEAGATLDGKVSPLASMGAARAETPSAKKNMAPRNDNAGEGNGSELPFSGNAAAGASK